MSRTSEAVISTVLTWTVLLAGLSGLVACGKKEESPEVVPVVSTGPDAEEMLAAMLRGHPNSKKICIDGNRENAFFLDYGPLPTEDKDRVLFAGGWLFIEKVKFYKTSNNTWFITDQDTKEYVYVHPDVTGLNCKMHNG